MLTQAVLLGSTSFRLENVTVEAHMITLNVSSVQTDAACPECRESCQRVHSHNGVQLYREIQQEGYSGSRPTVSRWAAKMRRQTPEPKGPKDSTPQLKQVTRPWSARYAVWLLLKQPEALEPDKKAALERMLDASPDLRPAYNFAQAFLRMVRNREVKGLRPWLDAVIEYKIPELCGFAKSLRQDFNAVYAALSLPWSNGQVEGQVNRLKMIKRQMYGRAGFDLLRQRVLAS